MATFEANGGMLSLDIPDDIVEMLGIRSVEDIVRVFYSPRADCWGIETKSLIWLPRFRVNDPDE